MLRGFIPGAIWGAILSGGVAGLASLSFPMPDEMAAKAPIAGAPPAQQVTGDVSPADDATAKAPVTGGSQFAQDRADNLGDLGADDPQIAVGDAARADAPGADDLAALGSDARQTADVPEIGGAVDAPAAPGDGATVAVQEPTGEQPILPNPQARAPDAPVIEPGPDAATEPAAPPRAEPGEVVTGFPTGDLDQAAVTPDAPIQAPDLPRPPSEPDQTTPANEPAIRSNVADPETPPDAPVDVGAARGDAPSQSAAPSTDPAPADLPAINPQPTVESSVETPATTGTQMRGQRALPLTERNRTAQIATANTTANTPANASPASTGPSDQNQAPETPQPPIDRFQAPFETPMTNP